MTDSGKKERREFHIPTAERERGFYGSEFEIQLKTKLTQRAIAKECAEWMRRKARFRSNRGQAPMQQFACLQNHVGERTRSNHKQYLIKRIAWRIQAQHEGGLSTRARRRAMELADDADLRVRPPVERPSNAPTDGDITMQTDFDAPPADDRLPMPGTTLSREYKGRTILVRVLRRGFEYEGKVYRSLSAVAKAVNPANPMPQTEATISAMIHNLGDFPAENVAVAFYDGSPVKKDLIGEVIIEGTLAGGQSAEVLINWITPASTEPRSIYVVVDPAGTHPDINLANNVAVLEPVMLADLEVENVSVQNIGAFNRLITARVRNVGALTIKSGYTLTFRKATPDGPVVHETTETATLEPGAH